MLMKVWKHFETKKEEFCNFLSKVEVRVSSFYKTLSECKDLTVVQTEITAQQVSGRVCGGVYACSVSVSVCV